MLHLLKIAANVTQQICFFSISGNSFNIVISTHAPLSFKHIMPPLGPRFRIRYPTLTIGIRAKGLVDDYYGLVFWVVLNHL